MTTEKSIPKEPRHAAVSEKSGSRSGGALFSGPLEGLLRPAGTVSEKQLCSEGSTGGNRMYTLNRRRAKKLIPVVGDQLPGCLPLLFQDLTKEALSGSAISPLGDQNIDHVSILIDNSPQVVMLTSDFDDEFIDVPDVAESSLFPTQFAGIVRAEF